MDAAKTKRRFPGYTLRELKERVAAGQGNEAMVLEIEARESGRRTPGVTPQIQGGLVIPRLGRM
jgi:hypothetical protein